MHSRHQIIRLFQFQSAPRALTESVPKTRLALTSSILTLILALVASPAALAVESGLLSYYCAQDVSNVGTCNANEVSLSGVTNVSITDVDDNPLAECIDGTQIKISNLEADLDSNTGERYDVTFWAGRYGNDPRVSTGDPTACVALSLPDDTGSPDIANFEKTADNCLDFQQPTTPITLQFGGNGATLTCADSDGNGVADVQVLTTWYQNEQFACGTGDSVGPPFDLDPPYLSPGAPSKCDFVVIPLVPIVQANPVITLTKTASPTTFATTGTLITYTFAVGNAGNVPLTNVSVTDPLPGLSAVTCPGGNPIPSLAVGASVNCTATLTTTQAQVDAGSITNTATATGSSPGNTNDVTATDGAIVNSTAGASINILKTPSPTSFNADGQLITYTLAVTNDGALTLSNVLVTDPLPGLSAITCPGGNPIPSLAPAASVNCTATRSTTADDVTATRIDNTATATGSSPGNVNDVTASDSATVSLGAIPSVQIVKTASPTSYSAANQLITYTLAVTNTGNAVLSNVLVSDPLTGLSAVTCTGGNPIPTLGLGASVNCTASLTTTQDQVNAGSITNTATATGSSPVNKNDVTASDSAVVNSTAGPSINIVKTPSPTSFSAVGQLITYTLAVTNDGTLTLSNVLVSDPLTGLSAVTCPGGNPIPSLAPTASVNCTATLTTTQAQVDTGPITNTATATGSSPGNTDDVTANDSATVTNAAVANYTITKAVTDVAGGGPDGVVTAAGDTITYEIVVNNVGGKTLNNVNVTDPLVTLTCNPAAPAILAPGATMTCTGTYVVAQADLDNSGKPTPGSGVVANTATVSSDELPDESDSESVDLPVPLNPPVEVVPVPANNPWALLLMLLSILGLGWYFGPAIRRSF